MNIFWKTQLFHDEDVMCNSTMKIYWYDRLLSVLLNRNLTNEWKQQNKAIKTVNYVIETEKSLGLQVYVPSFEILFVAQKPTA